MLDEFFDNVVTPICLSVFVIMLTLGFSAGVVYAVVYNYHWLFAWTGGR